MGNDWDYDEIQRKLDPTAPKEGEDAEVTDPEDDFFNMDPYENPTLKDAAEGESVEEEPEVPEKPEPKPPVAEPTDAQADALKAEVIKQYGEDFSLTIKGQERKLKDIPATELKNGLQKAFRGDQIFNELSQERRQIEESKRQFEEQRSRQEQELKDLRTQMETLNKMRSQPGPRYNQYGQPIVEDTNPSPYDSPEERAYKAEVAKTQERLSQLEQGIQKTSQEAFINNVQTEIKALAKDYPLAPLDEVVAVKLARPEVKTEELLKAAHDYYRSSERIELALANNPEYRQKLAEQIVKEFIAKRQSAKKIPGVGKSSSGSEKVVSKGKTTPIRDFRQADVASRAFLKELDRNERD